MAQTKSSRSRCCIISAITAVALVVVIAVVVPLAILLPRKGHNKSIVLVPLYMYPTSNSTWNPLYDAVEAHPSTQFLVVINPKNGPGSTAYPNEEYSTAIQQINSYSNVQTVGYIRTGYATKAMSEVEAELATYAGWSSHNSNLSMSGIFFDEAPHEYSAAAVEYMVKADQAVKDTDALGVRTIIHNPGTAPDHRYLADSNIDITVVFENSYDEWSAPDKVSSLAALPQQRSKYAVIVHSVPADAGKNGIRDFVGQVGKLAEYVFVTDKTVHYYESFGADWSDFIDVVPT